MKSFTKNILLLFLIFFCISCNKLSKHNFDKIQNGMTKNEVMKILGKPTNIKEAEALGLKKSECSWDVKGTKIRVTFVNDEVIAKRALIE